MPASPSSDDIPDNTDGFKTSRARYEFNIDRLAKKYGGVESNVEVDLRTFDMSGPDKEVQKEFKRLAQIGEKFSFATMSSPVANKAELESPQLVAKCMVLNDIFKSTHQGALGLPAPPTRFALPAPVNGDRRVAMVESPLTRSRSRAMLDEPSTSSGAGGGGGDGTPMRPTGGGKGGRKTGGGGMTVAATRDRSMMMGSGGQRGAAMMIEECEPEASGIVVRAQTVMGEMMNGGGGGEGEGTPAAKRRKTPKTATMHDAGEDDAASGFGGGNAAAAAPAAQRTPPNQMAIEQPVSSRTRSRARLSLTGASPLPIAATPAPPKVATGRRLKMPVQKSDEKEKEEGKDKEEQPKKRGRKPNQNKTKEEEDKNERKRISEDLPKDVPMKQARVTKPKVVAPPTPTVKEGKNEEKNGEESDGQNCAVVAKNGLVNRVIKNEVQDVVQLESDSSIQVVAHVYKDATTGRELVCPPESKEVKKNRIDSWIEDSFNRTISEHSSMDDGPSTSSSVPSSFGDFEKDKDVEGFDKIYRRISSSAKSRNSSLKMGMVGYGAVPSRYQ